MNLLFIGPEVTSVEKIRSFGAVWSFYLAREMRRRGIIVRFARAVMPSDPKIIDYYRELDVSGIDHVVALGLRLFTKLPTVCGRILLDKMRGRGVVAQLYDGHIPVNQCPGIVTFTVRDDAKCMSSADAVSNFHVGWAADPEMCVSDQPEDVLSILVDHTIYGEGRADRTRVILAELAHFANGPTWRKRFAGMRARMIVDGGVVDLDLTGDQQHRVLFFSRDHIPYPDICREYSQSHVFMVTHQELVGLSVLETATAGALPVAMSGFIPGDRLKTVRHVEYDDLIPWKRVVDEIDVEASRALAMKNSWEAVADRMVQHLLWRKS